MTHEARFRNVLTAVAAHLAVLTLCTYLALPNLGRDRETLPLIENQLKYSLWALSGFVPFLWIRVSTYWMMTIGATITAITASTAIWNALAATEHLAQTGKPGFEKGGYEGAIGALPMVFGMAFAVSFVILQLGQWTGRRKTIAAPPIVRHPNRD